LVQVFLTQLVAHHLSCVQITCFISRLRNNFDRNTKLMHFIAYEPGRVNASAEEPEVPRHGSQPGITRT